MSLLTSPACDTAPWTFSRVAQRGDRYREWGGKALLSGYSPFRGPSPWLPLAIDSKDRDAVLGIDPPNGDESEAKSSSPNHGSYVPCVLDLEYMSDCLR